MPDPERRSNWGVMRLEMPLPTGGDEDSLRGTEDELLRIRSALDDCGSAVVMLDRSIKVSYLNAAFGMIFGWTMENASELNLLNFFSNREEGRDIMGYILEGGSWQGETKMLNKECRDFPASVRGTPFLDDQYDVAGMFFIINDITPRKRLEAQLVQAQNMKSIGQLAAGIAHEINTPTQYVGDNLRFLQDNFPVLLQAFQSLIAILASARTRPLTPEEAAAADKAVLDADLEYLSSEVPLAIRQSLDGVQRVSQIVHAMRQFTHPGTDEKKSVDLAQAIESTATVARNEWRYVAELHTQFDETLPLVPCLPADLNQVLLNLIVNASHAIAEKLGAASEEKGTITITTRQDGPWAEIAVADTGTGIPESIHDRVFDPFFTTKEVGKGTGQGLAISHNVIVEKHHGTLTFTSEVGKGTTFYIRLPLVEQDWEAGRVEPKPPV